MRVTHVKDRLVALDAILDVGATTHSDSRHGHSGREVASTAAASPQHAGEQRRPVATFEVRETCGEDESSVDPWPWPAA
eukprot:2575380-Prymnesium_polylepis.3